MTFHDVFDPISVQQDIDRRRMGAQCPKEETESKRSARLADGFWLTMRSPTEKEKNNESDQK